MIRSSGGSKSYKVYLKNLFKTTPWNIETLEQMLLRRGFLVKLSEGKLFLSAGTTQTDLDFIQETCTGGTLVPFENKDFPYYLDYNSFDVRTAEKILFFCPRVGFTLIGRDKDSDPVKGFKLNKYGCKVPTIELDIGIAAFVRALPLLSVRTSYCCDGHDLVLPHIEFVSSVQQNWFDFLIKRLFLPNDLLLGIEFIYGPGHYFGGRVIFQAKDDKKDHVQVFEELYLASNFIRQTGSRELALKLKDDFIKTFDKVPAEI